MNAIRRMILGRPQPEPIPDPRDLSGNRAAFDSMPSWMTR